jgi:magnesium chelatase family protein
VRDLATARGWLNADIPQDQLDAVAPLSREAVNLLRNALELGNLTGRGYHRVRRVGRTIADLRHGGEIVQEDDIVAALSLRQSLNTRSKVKL